MQLALDDKTNDLILGSTGVDRVSNGRYTIQAVRSKLNTALGEWRLNPNLGWVGREDFEKHYDLFDLEIRAKQIILGTKGVLQIDSMELVVIDRKLELTFQATTIYGEIDLTIPWS